MTDDFSQKEKQPSTTTTSLPPQEMMIPISQIQIPQKKKNL